MYAGSRGIEPHNRLLSLEAIAIEGILNWKFLSFTSRTTAQYRFGPPKCKEFNIIHIVQCIKFFN